MNRLSQEYIQDLLKPLQEHQIPAECFHQHQAIVDFDHCLRTLEARYAELYEKVLSLEKVLSTYP